MRPTRSGHFSLLLFLALGLLSAPPQAALAKQAEASIALDLPTGEWKGVRLEKLPRDALLSFELVSDGPIEVLVLDGANYLLFPRPKHSLFQGATEDKIDASLRTPAFGDYYVVVDNRAGTEPRSVGVTVRGSTDDTSQRRGGSIDDFQNQLAAIFIYEPYELRIEPCLDGHSFRPEHSGGVVCREYMKRLAIQLGSDRSKGEDVFLLSLYHLLGHHLLEEWGHPDHASELVADEFGVALMGLLGNVDRLRKNAALFQRRAAAFDLIAKAFPEDRHPLTKTRSQALRAKLRDPNLFRRWQAFLIPHMEVTALRHFRDEPQVWTDVALIERELASR